MLTAFLTKAVEESADALEFEYKDRELIVMAYHAHMGVGIGAVEANSKDCKRPIDEVAALKRRKRIAVGGKTIGVSVSTYESFGETVWRIAIQGL